MRALAVILAGALAVSCSGPTLPVPDTEGLEPGVVAAIAEARQAAASRGDARELMIFGHVLLSHRLERDAEAVYVLAADVASDPHPCWYLASMAASRTSPERGIAHIRRALAVRAEHGLSHYRLGLSLHDIGDLDGAESALRRAVALDETAHSLAALGRVRLALRDTDEAIRLLERARELDPGIREVHATLAQAYAAAGNRRSSQASTSAAARCRSVRGPNDPIVAAALDHVASYHGLLLRARTIAMHGDTDRALALVDRARALRPGLPDADLTAGNALAGAGRLGEAIAAFNRALELSPGNPDALASVGTMLLSANRRDEAEASLRAALDADPRSWAARRTLMQLLALDRPDEATELANSLIRDDPGDLDARFVRAQIVAQRGDHVAARAELLEILKSDPEHGPSRALLARLRPPR